MRSLFDAASCSVISFPGALFLLALLLLAPAPVQAEPVHQSFAHVIGETVSLDIPEPGAGHIETAGSSDTYSFQGVAGERVYFQILSGSSSLADMRLTAPDDSVLFNAFGLFDRGPVELPLTGAYALRIAGRGTNTGTYSFRTNLTVDETFDYTIGDTVSDGVPEAGAGHIETPGSTDTYLFEGGAGQRIFFKPLAGSGTLADVRLTAPGGAVLINAIGFFNNGPLDLPETGTYVLRIAGRGSSTGAYSFAVTETVDEFFDYVIGDSVSDGVPEQGAGNLETPGSTDTYLFEGLAGQRIFFKPSGSGVLADVRLTAPDDSVIFNGTGLFNFGPLDLPQDGIYALRIASRTGLTGTYGFRVNQTVDQVFDYVLGDLVVEDEPGPGAGRLEEPGSTDTYLFEAEAGQSLRFARQSGASGLARVRLTSPEDSVLFETLSYTDAGPVTLPDSGIYALRIASQNGNSGSYSFLTASALGAPENVTIEAGDSQLVVSWTPPSVDGGVPPSSYAASASPGGASCTTASTACTLTGLVNGTTYAVRVVASNDEHDSFPSPPVFGMPVGLPGVPTAVGAIPADGAALVSWSPPASDGGSAILSYTVSASPGGAGCLVEEGTGCTLDGLDNGTEYEVVIFASNAIGDGPPSEPVSVTPQEPLIETTTDVLPAQDPARIGQALSFNIQVTGSGQAPIDGRANVTADSGESCSDEAPPAVSGEVAVFSCAMTFSTLGSRQITAAFSNSATHAASDSAPVTVTVMRFADLDITADDGQSHSVPGSEAAYVIVVSNLGPDPAPGSRVLIGIDPPLIDASWSCQATKGAHCPATSGSGDIDQVMDLPTAGALEYLLTGQLPGSLPPTVVLAAEVVADAAEPNHVFDPIMENNQDFDINTVVEIFADGFE